MKANSLDGLSRAELEDFLYGLVALQDARRWHEWLDFFTTDCCYWMPLKESATDPESELSIFYEDRALMRTRINRLLDPNAAGQQPPTRTSHVIGNVQIAGSGELAGELKVHSRFAMTEFRRDVHRQYAGRYTHHLCLVDGTVKIRLLRVDLLGADGLHEYNIQVFI
ncbi:MAG: aromatic-ring-hydroxylating dioxygenase subunit beta [Burkholderiales bacterium]